MPDPRRYQMKDSRPTSYVEQGSYRSTPPQATMNNIPHLRSNLDMRDHSQRDDGRLFLGGAAGHHHHPASSNDSRMLRSDSNNQLDAIEEARLERELLEKKKIHERSMSEQHSQSAPPASGTATTMRGHDSYGGDEDAYGQQQRGNYRPSTRGNGHYEHNQQHYPSARRPMTAGYDHRDASEANNRGYYDRDRERAGYPQHQASSYRSNGPPLNQSNHDAHAPHHALAEEGGTWERMKHVEPPPPPPILTQPKSPPTLLARHHQSQPQPQAEAPSSQIQKDSNSQPAVIDPKKTFASLFPKSPLIQQQASNEYDNEEQRESHSYNDDVDEAVTANIKVNETYFEDGNHRLEDGSLNSSRPRMLFDPKTNRMVDASDNQHLAANTSNKGVNARKNNLDRPLKPRNPRTSANEANVVDEKEISSGPRAMMTKEADATTNWRRSTSSEDTNHHYVSTKPSSNSKTEEQQRNREERERERQARGPRTNGVLYKYTDSGDLVQVLTAEEEAKLKLQAESMPHHPSISHSEKVKNSKREKREPSHPSSQSASTWARSSAPAASAIAPNPSISTARATVSSFAPSYPQTSSGVEVAVDLTSYDLDIHNLAAAADGLALSRSTSSRFQTFLPGYGLTESTATSIPIVAASKATGHEQQLDGMEDMTTHIEDLLRSVELEETSL
jgi:hypothetical protein